MSSLVVFDCMIPLGSYSRLAKIYKTPGNPSYYFIQNDFYFARGDMYGVKLWASQHNRSQTPTLQAELAGDIILVRAKAITSD